MYHKNLTLKSTRNNDINDLKIVLYKNTLKLDNGVEPHNDHKVGVYVFADVF